MIFLVINLALQSRLVSQTQNIPIIEKAPSLYKLC